MTLLQKLSLTYTNLRSTSLSGRFLFIESDDWGMIRMKSREVREKLKYKGYKIDDCPFNTYDRLESNKDVEALLETLISVKDYKERPGLLIANNVVGNPDFDKIRKSGFNDYEFEIFTETYKRYQDSNNVLSLMKEGMKNGCILPQFHGREHVHINRWMKDLQNGVKSAKDAFENNMFTITTGKNSSCKKEYLDAMAIYEAADYEVVKKSIAEGMSIFKRVWGYSSVSAIAPCYIWSDEVENILKTQGVKIIQSGRAQVKPQNNRVEIIRRYTGQRNKLDQTYTVRNVFFEPSTNLDKDWIDHAMYQIKNAFNYGAPAILNTHRLNFIGSIEPKMRDFSLTCLSALLKKVKKTWPDVQFANPFIERFNDYE